MFRTIQDFQAGWAYEREATLKILRALTDQVLPQAVAPGGRTLGRLGWHIVQTLREMGGHAGLEVDGPDEKAPQPNATGMREAYERASKSLADAVTRQWTDGMLLETIPMYGEQWPRGQALSSLVAHQIHHRAQMTVLMRQAGLKVPGVYGPAREEWAAFNVPPQE